MARCSTGISRNPRHLMGATGIQRQRLAKVIRPRSSGPNPCANYAVARVKESLWVGSYIGVS